MSDSLVDEFMRETPLLMSRIIGDFNEKREFAYEKAGSYQSVFKNDLSIRMDESGYALTVNLVSKKGEPAKEPMTVSVRIEEETGYVHFEDGDMKDAVPYTGFSDVSREIESFVQLAIRDRCEEAVENAQSKEQGERKYTPTVSRGVEYV